MLQGALSREYAALAAPRDQDEKARLYQHLVLEGYLRVSGERSDAGNEAERWATLHDALFSISTGRQYHDMVLMKIVDVVY